MRMDVARLQRHQVDDIDDADLQLGQVLAQESDGRQRLERRHIARAGHDHIRFAAAIVAGPLPDADAAPCNARSPRPCVSHCGAGCLPATITLM